VLQSTTPPGTLLLEQLGLPRRAGAAAPLDQIDDVDDAVNLRLGVPETGPQLLSKLVQVERGRNLGDVRKGIHRVLDRQVRAVLLKERVVLAIEYGHGDGFCSGQEYKIARHCNLEIKNFPSATFASTVDIDFASYEILLARKKRSL
jgi:hypothetical protein